jgi:glycosyltransferase involved in cell wall biosynthesis
MRILIVHNILWAHYKSSVFQALQKLVDQHPDTTLNVLQIARNERSRAGLEAATESQTIDAPVYTYKYELLFDRYLEDVSVKERTLALLRHARSFKPDVITLTGYYDPAQVVLLFWAKQQGIRIVMQNESTNADHDRGGWKEWLKRWIINQCDGYFCFGNSSADYFINLGVPPERILLRKNAVDNNALLSAYQRASLKRSEQQQLVGIQPNNFVFVGRLIDLKNLPALVSAFAEAHQQSPNAANWGLVLLGDGPELTSLQQQVSTAGLSNFVRFLPGRPWYQVPDILALANVLVLPSRSEPWGLVVNEAMACGMPVLVSNRCGCVRDLLRDGENGLVFDPDQPDQLTDCLIQFMNGTVNETKMGQAAKQTIAPYSPESVAQEMLNGFVKTLRT